MANMKISLPTARIESYNFTELVFLFTTVYTIWWVLILRFLNFDKVSGECLNPKLEPAIFNILYLGLKRSK